MPDEKNINVSSGGNNGLAIIIATIIIVLVLALLVVYYIVPAITGSAENAGDIQVNIPDQINVSAPSESGNDGGTQN